MNHLAAGRASLDARERARLESLELLAAQRALASAAFDAAHRILGQAIAALTKDAWAERYERVLELHLEGARAAWLSGDRETMERLVRTTCEHARTAIDRVRARAIEIDALVAQQRFGDAVSLGLEVLPELGVVYPAKPTQAEAGAAIMATIAALG